MSAPDLLHPCQSNHRQKPTDGRDSARTQGLSAFPITARPDGADLVPYGMALNIRLTETEDAALTELATIEGISKNDAVRRAILDRHTRTVRRRDIDEATTWARQHYRGLLDRLAQ